MQRLLDISYGIGNRYILFYLKLLKHHIERCLIHKTIRAQKKFKEISDKKESKLPARGAGCWLWWGVLRGCVASAHKISVSIRGVVIITVYPPRPTPPPPLWCRSKVNDVRHTICRAPPRPASSDTDYCSLLCTSDFMPVN